MEQVHGLKWNLYRSPREPAPFSSEPAPCEQESVSRTPQIRPEAERKQNGNASSAVISFSRTEAPPGLRWPGEFAGSPGDPGGRSGKRRGRPGSRNRQKIWSSMRPGGCSQVYELLKKYFKKIKKNT